MEDEWFDTDVTESTVEAECVDESHIVDKRVLDAWFTSAVCTYPSGRKIDKSCLSEAEVEIINKSSVCSGFDITYHLLGKYGIASFDDQLPKALSMKDHLESKRVPKEYLGGFLILLTKYHFLPC